MGEYRIVRHSSNDDYLEHAIFGFGKKSATTTGGTGNVGGSKKGWQKQGAAYLARAWLGGKWRYAYTDAEVKWLQNWGKPKKGTNVNSKEYKEYEKKLKNAQKENKAAAKQVEKSGAKLRTAYDSAKKETKRNINDAVTNVRETVSDTVDSVKNSNVTKYASAKAEKAKDLGEYAARSLFDKEFREAGKDPTKYDARRAELDRELRDDDKNAEKAKQNIQKEQEKKAKEKQREKEKAAKAAEKEAKKAEKAAEKEAREAERRAEAEKEAVAKSKLTDSGSGADRTEPKGGDGDDVIQEKTSLLDRGKAALRNAGRDVADDAGRLRRKAKMSLGNITDKAKETVSGFKNYSEDVDKREAENTQLMKDISSTRRQVQSEGARESAKSAHDEAVKNATDIQKEKSSLKYKLSDLMSKGKDSETFKSGKREAELLLDREGKPLLNKASKALDKGKEWAGDTANKAKEKISEVGADSRNYSAAKKALTNAEAKYAQATEDYNKAMEKYKKAGANPLVRNELDAAIAAQKKAAEERQTAQTNFKRVQESTSSAAEGLDNAKSGLKDIFGRAASSAKERGAQAMESLSKQSKEESGGSSTDSTSSASDKAEESKSGSDSAKSGSLKERVKAAVDKYAGPVINKLKGLDNATSPADRKEKLNAVKEAMETLEEKARERLKTYEDKGGKSSPEYQAAKMTYDQIDKMGTKIRGGQYGWVGSYDQIERMMKDGISEDDAFLFENYARASHELHRSMTEDEYNAWIADYNKKHGKNY